jgi:hypothetical protein
LAFFQLLMQGGIFQSAWSFTLTARGGECMTGTGGEPLARGTCRARTGNPHTLSKPLLWLHMGFRCTCMPGEVMQWMQVAPAALRPIKWQALVWRFVSVMLAQQLVVMTPSPLCS